MLHNAPTHSGIFYSASHPRPQPKDAAELFGYAENDSQRDIKSVCVIENISSSMSQSICDAWKLDTRIFDHHSMSPDVGDLWGHIHGKTRKADSSSDHYRHLDGIYEYNSIKMTMDMLRSINPNNCHRHVFQQIGYAVSSNTRVTYCRPRPNLYLFLVDTPFPCEQALVEPTYPLSQCTLRFPYARNYGGVLIPRIKKEGPICNLFNALRTTFAHAWEVEFLFGIPELIPCSPLLYLLSYSLWELEFRALDAEMKRISFVDILDPEIEITDSLHKLRASLADLRTVVTETVTYLPPDVKQFLQNAASHRSQPIPIPDLLEGLQSRASELHTFFIETIQLVASTISIRDSQFSIEQTKESLKQTRQGTFLTTLAALYLPLSVATGVFGMNLKQINDSTPQWWAFLIVLVGLSLLTFALLWVGMGGDYLIWRRKSPGKISNTYRAAQSRKNDTAMSVTKV